MGVTFVRDTEGLLRTAAGPGRPEVALADGARVAWDQDRPLTLTVGGDARAEVEVGGRAGPVIHCGDRSALKLTTHGESRPSVTLSRHADFRASTHGTSGPRVEAAGASRVLVLAYDSSRPRLRTTDIAVAKVVVYDRARPHWEGWPPGWEPRASDIYVGQRLACFETEGEAVAAAERVYDEWRQCGSRYLACVRSTGAVLRLCPNVVDVRWRRGTVHLELPGEGNPRAWYSPDAHHEDQLTEDRRASCRKCYLKL